MPHREASHDSPLPLGPTPARQDLLRRRPRWRFALLIASVVTAIAAWRYVGASPKRFGVVADGQVYRSGDISPTQLERLGRDLKLHAVLSLLNPAAPESQAESAKAAELGLKWINIPLTGDGASTPADRDRIRAVVLDPANRPLLIHCSAGTNRTGLAVGMYRIYVDGWSYEQVLAEMKRYDFEDEAHHENLRQALQDEVKLRDAE